MVIAINSELEETLRAIAEWLEAFTPSRYLSTELVGIIGADCVKRAWLEWLEAYSEVVKALKELVQSRKGV